MLEQAKDKKGKFLYHVSVEKIVGEILKIKWYTLARKKPIKNLSRVLKGILAKEKDYSYGSLSVYRLCDYERNNPV